MPSHRNIETQIYSIHDIDRLWGFFRRGRALISTTITLDKTHLSQCSAFVDANPIYLYVLGIHIHFYIIRLQHVFLFHIPLFASCCLIISLIYMATFCDHRSPHIHHTYRILHGTISHTSCNQSQGVWCEHIASPLLPRAQLLGTQPQDRIRWISKRMYGGSRQGKYLA